MDISEACTLHILGSGYGHFPIDRQSGTCTYRHVPLNILLRVKIQIAESTLEVCQVQQLVFQVKARLCAHCSERRLLANSPNVAQQQQHQPVSRQGEGNLDSGQISKDKPLLLIDVIFIRRCCCRCWPKKCSVGQSETKNLYIIHLWNFFTIPLLFVT